MIASYGFTDAMVTEDPTLAGNRLLNTPRTTASLFVTHQVGLVAPATSLGSLSLGDGFLELGWGSRYVGERPGDAANSFTLPDYVVCDAFLSYRTSVNGLPAALQLNLENVLDETYYPSSGASNVLVAVGEPFQALMTARVSW